MKKKAKPKPRRSSKPWLRRALISVSDKTGVIEFARGLANLGYEIVSTGGTARTLQEAGLLVTLVEEVTGFPEMLDGRVKTLHPRVFGGILAELKPEHEKQIKAKHIRRFQVVCVNLYPFEQTVVKPGASHHDIVEQIDIGGPSLLRAAAKNADNGVTVVCDPADYQKVIDEITSGSHVTLATRQQLAAKALLRTALYDAVISTYLTKQVGNPMTLLALKPVRRMRKGENPYQDPAWLCQNLLARPNPLAWHNWEYVAGNPGYVNLCGGDNALRVMCRLMEAFRRNFDDKMPLPFIAIACKHGNPCGLGIDFIHPSLALERCMAGDNDAVMGAEVMVNFAVDAEAAVRIHVVLQKLREKVGRNYWGPDVVFAPCFNEAAMSLLTTRTPERHLVANPALTDLIWPLEEITIRPVIGGALIQPAPNFVFVHNEVEEWLNHSAPLTREDMATLLIAWVVAYEGVSNSGTLAKALSLIGTGLGQQDRRGANKLMITRTRDAGHDPAGSWFTQDGFLPFAKAETGALPEATEMLRDAGCVGGVVQADGKNWPQVRQFLLDSCMTIAVLHRDFRGFARH